MSDYPKRIWIGSAAWFDRSYGNQQGYVREDLATAQDCILEVDRQARRIESLTSENTRLREALEFIRGTSTSVPLGEWEQVFLRQQVLSCIHQAEMALESPGHKGED